jgi:hypothetical protein
VLYRVACAKAAVLLNFFIFTTFSLALLFHTLSPLLFSFVLAYAIKTSTENQLELKENWKNRILFYNDNLNLSGTNGALRVASHTTFIYYYYFLKHSIFGSTPSSSGVYFIQNLKLKVKMEFFARSHT